MVQINKEVDIGIVADAAESYFRGAKPNHLQKNATIRRLVASHLPEEADPHKIDEVEAQVREEIFRRICKRAEGSGTVVIGRATTGQLMFAGKSSANWLDDLEARHEENHQGFPTPTGAA